MLRPSDVNFLLKGVSDIFTIDSNAEVTVECHPNTVGERRFKEYKSAGVNRVTLGIQSFSDSNLTAIGRDHTADKNRKILSEARNVGFNNVGIDLMYRLPDQNIENLMQELEIVTKFSPDTVSAYSLEADETILNGKGRIPSDIMDREMFYLVGDYLKTLGYNQYMQPDFALPGKECQYVVNAWQAPQKLLLGLGAGANTHYFGGHSWTNVYSVIEYIKALNSECSPIVSGNNVGVEELKAKYMVLGVRGINIDKSEFKKLFGEEIAHKFRLQITKLITKGWLSDNNNSFEVTRQGLPYINNISKEFYTTKNIGKPQPWYNDIHTFVPEKYYKIGEK
jgi:oxygen-independent coproporphyrinogen-3 oxidase